MTRIAILPSAYPPAVGGVEELTRHLALALADAGDEVEVWTLHGDDARPETVEVRDDLIVRRFPMPLPATKWSSLHRSATIGPRTLFSLRNAADAFRPDVLHVVCFGPNGAYATALARLTGRPLVVTLQGETVMDDTDIFDTSRVLRSALRRGLRAAAAVTACSAFTLDDAEQRFGLEPGRGLVIPNGVDLAGTHSGTVEPPSDPEGRPGAEDQPDLPGGPYILALGRVVEKKGFDLLLAAYAAFITTEQNRPTPDLVIGGTGAALDGLVEMADSLGVAQRVHFPGRLRRDQVARAMAGADLFVMPSRLEPFGIVILEGWRAGVAVMATTRGGPPEFVHDGVDGVLVDPFDTPAFAGALEQLLTDDDRRRSVAAAGAARVVDFAWPAIADRYRAVYASVLPADPADPAGPTTRGSDDVPAELSRPPQGESVS
jgi:glycosyltransferase involved in cell wall biosynthesis